MPIGSRIRTRFDRPAPALVAAFAGLSTCDIADATGRLWVVDPALHHVGGGPSLVGVALPVWTRPDDHLMVQAAIDVAQPGDVIVVNAGGGIQTAMVGEMVSLWAKQRGVAGFVIDGAVRDVEMLALPTFARGRSARAPFRQAAGEVGFPIALGGVPVAPGDIVVADADGVAVVPLADAETVLEGVRKVVAKDQAARVAIPAGTWDRSWVRPALQAAGIEEVD